MTTSTIAKTFAALVTVSFLAVGCGGSSETSESSSAASTTPSDTAAPPLTDQQEAPARLNVDVTIKAGEVTPTNATLEARVGQPIVIRVNSDAADELHVHSNPEHSFPIEAKSGQAFQFTVEVPGKADVELHDLNKTIATIAVQQ